MHHDVAKLAIATTANTACYCMSHACTLVFRCNLNKIISYCDNSKNDMMVNVALYIGTFYVQHTIINLMTPAAHMQAESSSACCMYV